MKRKTNDLSHRRIGIVLAGLALVYALTAGFAWSRAIDSGPCNVPLISCLAETTDAGVRPGPALLLPEGQRVGLTPAPAQDHGLLARADFVHAGDGSMGEQRAAVPKPVSGTSPRSSARLRGRWEADFSIRSYYDDNILDYSPRDLDHFRSGVRLNKFSVKTTGDWISDLGGNLGRRWGTKARGEYRLRFMANAHWYARNAIKDWLDYGLEGRWLHLRKTLIVHLGWTPHFYLRDLQARDAPRQYPASPVYVPANYHSWSANGEYRFELGIPVEQRLSAGWKRTNYNHVYDERDNTTWWGEYGWQVPLGSGWTAGWSYRYASISAVGADRPANVVDVSRREHTFEGGLAYDSRAIIGADVDVLYEHQRFTSRKPTDLDHYGRHDNELRITPEIRFSLKGGWRHRLFYQWTHDTSNTKQTADLGAFDDNQFGLRLSYSW